jgi:hypothetical protein
MFIMSFLRTIEIDTVVNFQKNSNIIFQKKTTARPYSILWRVFVRAGGREAWPNGFRYTRPA